MSKIKLYDIVLVGAGPIGLFVFYQSKLFNLKICQVELLKSVGGQCSYLYPGKYIYDVPCFNYITGYYLINKLKKQIGNYSLIITEEEYLDLKKIEHYWISITNKRVIISKTIVLGVGNGKLENKKINKLNIVHDKICNKIFYNIKNKFFFHNKTVAIIGGGSSSVDWAINLACNVAKYIYIIHRKNSFKAHPKDISTIINSNIIEVYTECIFQSINYQNQLELKILDIKSNCTKLIKIDYLLVFIGMVNNSKIFKLWNINFIRSKILVSCKNLQSSFINVFVIGDSCIYDNKNNLIINGFSDANVLIKFIYKNIKMNSNIFFKHSTTK